MLTQTAFLIRKNKIYIKVVILDTTNITVQNSLAFIIMDTRLVLWGEIGTDRKALIAIYLDESIAKIHTYAFLKEDATKELQSKLLTE